MKTRLQTGNRLLVEKRYAEAVAHFLGHARAVPSEAPRAYVQAAECLRRSDVLPHPIEVAPGITLISQGDQHGAVRLLRMALELDPGYVPALRTLAQVLEHDSSEQVSVLERAASLRPDELVVSLLGSYYERHAFRAAAISLYKKALEHRPNDGALNALLVRALSAEGAQGGPTTG